MPPASRKYFLQILPLFILLGNCKQKHPGHLFRAMEYQLNTASQSVNLSTLTLMKELDNKKTDPGVNRETALYWFGIAQNIQHYIKQLYDKLGEWQYADQLNRQEIDTLLGELSGLPEKINKLNPVFSEVLMHGKLAPDSLQYRVADSLVYIPLTSDNFTSNRTATIALLQNRLKNIEYRLVMFCNTKVGSVSDWFYTFDPFITQNQTYLSPGEELVIKAGIGAYSKMTDPEIKINGRIIPLGEYSYSSYRIKAGEKPGTYYIPVEITHTDYYTEEKKTVKQFIKYIITRPCGQ